MPIRKPVEQMSEKEVREALLKHRKDQLERSQKAAAKRREKGLVRLTVHVPEGAREKAREAVERVVQEYNNSTKFPFDEPERN